MKVIKIKKEDWTSGIDALRQSYRLFGPVKDGEFHRFMELDDGEQADLEYRNTRLSAKSVVYPQSQVMFEYSLDEKETDHHILKPAAYDEAPKAVIGIRPCDADAFPLVRRNFDTSEYQDPYWIKAYESTTFVGLACHHPCDTCFCTTAGSGPFSDTALDVLLVDADDHFLASAVTDKGVAFLDAGNWTAEAGDPDALDALKQAAEERIVSKIATDKLSNTATTEIYDAPFWDDVAFACINCGTCTYLCPTCWCFDIQDENAGKQGVRMRNWDSCMFPLFTLHGSGHNPRGVKIQRVRQRFMHKLKYYVDKYRDGIQCVCCGRCIQYCPVDVDLRKVCNLMNSRGDANVACEVKGAQH